MRFDPALAACRSFRLATEARELGADSDTAIEAEAIFSASIGAEAAAAYASLQAIGERHPEAIAFQEFLIYITWQQATEETSPAHFRTGATLCEHYLHRHGADPDRPVEQIRELQRSFLAALGLDDEEPDEYDEDTFKGGD